MIDTARERGRRVQPKVTEIQRRVLEKLIVFTELRGFCPSMSELARSLRLSPSTVYRLVKELEQMGYIHRNSGKSRSMRVLKDPAHVIEPVQQEGPVPELIPMVTVPILGTVKAGPTMLAEEHWVGKVVLSRDVLWDGNTNARLFAMRISSDSMIEVGIHERDLVIVQQQPLAGDGDIIVALLDGEVTVKRLSISGEVIELRAANKDYQSTKISPFSDFRVLGKVLGVISGYEV